MNYFRGLYSPSKGGYNNKPSMPPPLAPKGGSGETGEYFCGKYGFENDKKAKEILKRWNEGRCSIHEELKELQKLEKYLLDPSIVCKLQVMLYDGKSLLEAIRSIKEK